MFSLSADQYDQFLSEHKVITGTPQADMVKGTGQNIRRTVGTNLTYRGQQSFLYGYNWKFNLVSGSSINTVTVPGEQCGGFLWISADRDK